MLRAKKEDFEIKWLQDDIKRLKSEIAETQKTIGKYEKQLEGEIECERVLLTEIPESMKNLKTELVKRWNAHDFKRKTDLKREYAEKGYECEFP